MKTCSLKGRPVKKRVVPLLLSLCLVMSLLPMTVFAAETDEYQAMELDTEYIAEIESEGEYAYFTFTAEESGYYQFYSTGDEDTYGYLYDMDMNFLMSDDDSGQDVNFCIMVYLEEGENCILGVGYYSSESTGSISVYVSSIEIEAMELDTEYIAEIESEGEYAYFTFTAEESGYYQFCFTGEENIAVYLYDTDWTCIMGSTYFVGTYIEEGETYIVGYCYVSDATGSISVYVSSYELEEMQLDTEYTADIENGGEIVYFSFTAEETGFYQFYSTGDGDTFGYLFDAEWKNLIAYDDDSGEDWNCSITVYLEAGETCIVGFSYLDDSTGSFSVYVSSFEIEEMQLDTESIAEIENAGDIAYFAFTPEESGYYQFYSTGDEDTYGYVYDSDFNYINEDDDWGLGLNTCVKVYLEAGETYIAGFCYLSEEDTGSFSVYVSTCEITAEMQLDTEYTVEIESEGEQVYFTFTPEESDYYKFYTTADEDTDVYVYDSSFDFMNSGNPVMVYLEAGETYIAGFCYASEDATGSFSASVSTIPEDQCGDNAYWKIENGTLYITGTGEMYDYEQLVAGPWYSYVDEITSIVIEDGITYIGTYAFWYMYNVTSVTIGSTVETIAAGAFDTISASEIVIPASVTYIGDSAFVNCYSLESITFEEGSALEYIGSNAFANCTGLTEITLPDSVTYIGDYTFGDCTGLESITLSESLETIDLWAFYGCTSLTEISIPDSVTYIGYYAFYYCTSLESVTLSESLETIESFAFYECTSLTDVTIPASVEYIGYLVFDGCEALSTVTFEGDLPEAYYIFGDLSQTITIYISSCYINSLDEDLLQTLVGDVSYTLETYENHTYPEWYPTEYNGHSYYIFSMEDLGLETWEEAEAYCESVGGYLSAITTAEEDAFLYSYISGTSYNDKCVYFGLSDAKEEGVWVWANGEETEYTNWNEESGEPNGGTDENYAEYHEGNTDGTWNDTGVGEAVAFLCEWDSEEDIPEDLFTGPEITEATCTEDGYLTYICAVCGEEVTEIVEEATGHSYVAVVTSPTCTENGYTTFTCSVCGDTYTALQTSATGHSYDEGVITKEATETEDGEITYTCTVCGDTYTETIPATGSSDTGSDDADDTDTDDTVDDTVADDTGSDDTADDTGSDDTTGEADTDDTAGDTGSEDATGEADTDDTAGEADTEDTTAPEEEEETDLVNGLANLGDGWALYADSEVVDYTGLVYNDKTYGGEYGWYYVANGYVDFSYTGLVKYDGTSNGIKSGKSGWYYVKNAFVDFSVTDVVYNDGTYGTAGWYYVQNAYVDFSYTGLVKHSADNGGVSGWYYVKNAYVDFTVTGIVYNSGRHGVSGYWYVKNANVKFGYNGVYTVNGISYSVTNGYAGK